MSGMGYLDFYVQVQQEGPGAYVVQVQPGSPYSGGEAHFRWPPLPDGPLAALLPGALAATPDPAPPAQPQRSVLPGGAVRLEEDREAARRLGGGLFGAVFQHGVKEDLRQSLQRAESNGQGLRIRLMLQKAPELAALPWEYLYDAEQGQFLALWNRTPVVRYLHRGGSFLASPIQAPLRVLVMIAQAAQAAQAPSPAPGEGPVRPQLDVEAEWCALREALEPLQREGQVELTRLDTATLEALRRQLRQGPYHIFHFIGHGGFDPAAETATLLLQDGPGDGERLANTLRNAGGEPPRLAILNACETADTAGSNPFVGMAQGLVQREDIPAVLAMRSRISDRAAIAFSRELYRALADGAPLEAAVTDARGAVDSQSGPRPEFGTPVLYLNVADGDVLRLTPLQPEVRRRNRIASLDQDAARAATAGDWEAAYQHLEELQQLAPADEGVRLRLEQAQRRLGQARQENDLPRLYSLGEQYLRDGRPLEALEYLQQVHQIRSDYQAVTRLLQTARRALEGGVTPLPAIQAPDALPSPQGESAHGESPQGESAHGERLEQHYQEVISELTAGGVVFVLGGDANLCGRRAGQSWRLGQAECLPTADELAAHLAAWRRYPTIPAPDLVRVSQFAATTYSTAALNRELRRIFDLDYQPTRVHEFLAGLPALLEAKGFLQRYPLIVTTNFDDVLERLLRASGAGFDTLRYAAESARFEHLPSDSDAPPRPIEKANEDLRVSPDRRTVLLKVHGTIDRADPRRDSFVVAEDQYIDYVTRSDVSSLVPVEVLDKLRNSYLLFLGYSPRDWYLRVFFRRLWADKPSPGIFSWVVPGRPPPEQDDPVGRYEKRFWETRNADLLDVPLEQYVGGLERRLRQLP